MRYMLKHFESFLTSSGKASGAGGQEGAVLAVLKGPLHVERLKESLNRAALQHPALRATFVPPEGKAASHWVVHEDQEVPLRTAIVEATQAEGGASLFHDPINLMTACGVRASVLQRSASEQSLRLDFHGAVCDGRAALRYFEDVMAAYAFEHGAERRVAPNMFADRAMDYPTKPLVVPTLWWVWRVFVAVVAKSFLSLRPGGSAWTGRASSARGQSSPKTVTTLQLTADQTTTFAAVGRRAGGSLTEVILRDLTMALRGGSVLGALSWDGDVLVERSLRKGADIRMPQANLTGLTWLRVPPQELSDRTSALRSVLWAVASLGERVLSMWDLKALRSCQWFWRRLVPQWVGTVPFPLVFSDGGIPFAATYLPRDADGAVVARGVRIENVSLIPPLWDVGALGIGIVTYRKAVRLAMQSHPDGATPEAQEEIMTLIEERMYETASEPGRETLALDALLEAHAKMSHTVSPLRSLPIGKHVVPEAPRLKDPRSTTVHLPETQAGEHRSS